MNEGLRNCGGTFIEGVAEGFVDHDSDIGGRNVFCGDEKLSKRAVVSGGLLAKLAFRRRHSLGDIKDSLGAEDLLIGLVRKGESDPEGPKPCCH